MAEEKGLRALSFKERLVLAQNELKAPKGQFNNFGKYKYRSAEDILEAVKPVNLKFSLTLTIKDDVVMVGNRIYIKATATLEDALSDEYTEVISLARESETKKGMDDSQVTGTASSYARKYALNGLYLIDDTKDSDTNEHAETQNNAPRNEPKQEVKPATDIQKSGLKKLMESLTEHTGRTYQEIEAVVMQKGNVPRKPYEQITNEDYGRMLAYTKGLIEYYDKQKNEQSSMEFTYGGNDQ